MNRTSLAGRIVSSAALLLLSAGANRDGWKRVEPGLALTYPADHGAHPQYQTEWWYVTGQLEDEAGARFGFQFTVFRRGLEPGALPANGSPLRAREAYAGHLVLTDVARGEKRFAERLRRASPLARAAEGELDVRLEDWSLVRRRSGENGEASEELRLAAGDPARSFAFAFTLRPEKPLVLHGENGYSQKGGERGNASAYASWTRLAVGGSLRLDGRELTVRGSAWYDHEFGSSVLSDGDVGWDWFGLQLDDGRELMLFRLRDAEGETTTSAATLVARDGTARQVGFALQRQAAWTSPRTGAVYPSRWTIALPDEGLALEIEPLVADSELVTSLSTSTTYWEGPVEVKGAVTGRGYAELTGYAAPMTGRF